MNKIFYYAILFLTWSIGCFYEATAASAEVAPSTEVFFKPPTKFCMDWLQDLQTERYHLSHSKQKDAHKRIRAITHEISATIGGKYGVSSTPATLAETQFILNLIATTRQILSNQLDMIPDVYLGYREAVKSSERLSETQLQQIAQENRIDRKILQGHLAAVSAADCASFILQQKEPKNDDLLASNLRNNIYRIHGQQYKKHLERLLKTFSDQTCSQIVRILAELSQNTDSKGQKPLSISEGPRAISQKTYDDFPQTVKEQYPVGSNVAILAGCIFMGRGAKSHDFFTINNDAWSLPDFCADFTQPALFDHLEGQFDVVVIELPEPENLFSKGLYFTARKLLKAGGLLEVSVYSIDGVCSSFDSSPEGKDYIAQLLEVQQEFEAWFKRDGIQKPDILLNEKGAFEYYNLIQQRLLLWHLAQMNHIFVPIMAQQYEPGEILPVVKTRTPSDYFTSSTQKNYTYCFLKAS